MSLYLGLKSNVWAMAVFFVLIGAISQNSWAGCSGNSCTDVTITRIVVNSSGDVSIGTSGDESRLTCDDNNKGYISLPADLPGFNQIYAMLLSAQATNNPLWIRANDNGYCRVSYVVSDR